MRSTKRSLHSNVKFIQNGTLPERPIENVALFLFEQKYVSTFLGNATILMETIMNSINFISQLS